MEKVKKGRPFGFYVCALGFTFERLAFYTMKYLLAIWIATEVASGGLGLSDIEASAMSGSLWPFRTLRLFLAVTLRIIGSAREFAYR